MAEVPPELAAEVQKLERYHTENPQGRYFVPLANAYRKMGELEQAEALLREGLRRHPDYLSAHIVLGRCLADRGAVHEATEEFRHVLSVDPQNLIALRSLGELASDQGRAEEAARWYRELLAVDPMNEEARQALEALEATPPPPLPEEDFQEGAGWWERPAEEEAGVGMADDTLEWDAPGAEAEPPVPEPAEEAPAWGEITLEPVGAAPGEETEPAPEPYGTLDLGDLELAEPEAEPAAALPVPDMADAEGWDPLAQGNVDLGDVDLGAVPGEEEPAEDEEAEVVTETIAELYTRQGFHDRAADVYRELIRRRGEEPGLVQRLAEVERLAAGEPEAPAPSAEAPPAPAGEPAPVEEPPALPSVPEEPALLPSGEEEAAPAIVGAEADTFASTFEFGFAGEPLPVFGAGGDLAEVAAPGESFPAPAVEAAPVPPRETVRDYLAALVAWSPGLPAAAPEPAPEPRPEETAASAEETVGEPAEELPWLTPSTEEPAAGAAPEMGEDAVPGLPALSDEAAYPWELAEESTPTEPAEPGLREEGGFSFEEFFVEEAEAPAPAAPESPLPTLPDAPEPAQPAAEAGGEEDEDLESFQAWLQSLKR